MKHLLMAGAAGLLLSGCVVVVDGTSGAVKTTNFADYDGPFESATEQDIEPFSKLSVNAGSDVVLLHGDGYRISLDEKAAASARFGVKGDELVINCAKPCRNGVKGKIQVTAPSVTGLSASSGAYLDIENGFDVVDTLSLSVSSGGDIDARQLEARNVTASASSGGSAEIVATESLTASASSGGSIRYGGDPTNVRESESSGGRVSSR
jgi:hypothetical protein